MKASELMIGDWVDFYHPYETEKKIVTRHRVTENFECGLVGISNHPNPVHADHIEPIKITSEILEKNGFVFLSGLWYLITKERKPIHIVFKDNNVITLSINATPVPIGLKYVHQLQHALRLYGIEKEIVL